MLRSARKRHIVLAAVGLLISATLAASAFVDVSWRPAGPGQSPLLAMAWRFPLHDWLLALPQQVGWVVPMALLVGAQPLLRAIVWRRVQRAKPWPAPRLGHCYHALTLGALVHNVLPGRLGLAASAWVLSRWSGAPFVALLSSLLTVKLAELAALVAGGAGLVWVIDAVVERAPAVAVAGGGAAAGTGALGRLVLAGAAAVAILGAAALAAAHGAPRLAARLDGHGRRPRLARAVTALGQGFAALRSGSHAGASLALAVLPVAAGALGYGIAVAKLGGLGAAGVAGGALILVAVTFGQLTPGLPVGIGMHYLVAAWAARQLGVAADGAATLAVLSHATTAAVSMVLGLVSAVVHRESLRELLRLRRAGVSTTDLLADAQPPPLSMAEAEASPRPP